MTAICTLQAGGTLNPRRHVYIKRPADDRLFALLREGRYVNVLSSRQMGKSSLMRRSLISSLGVATPTRQKVIRP